MRLAVRQALDKAFTILACAAVVVLSAVLLAVLGPILLKGTGAMVFYGTIEFRRMQLDHFGRGRQAGLDREITSANQARQRVYELIDRFKRQMDTSPLRDKVLDTYSQFGRHLKDSGIDAQQYYQIRSISRRIRDALLDALDSSDRQQIESDIAYVLSLEDEPALAGTPAAGFFQVARQIQQITAGMDLALRQQYASALAQLERIIDALLGPRPGAELTLLVSQRYGATRWDQALTLLHQFQFAEQWVPGRPGGPLVRTEVPRRQQFAGTELEQLFDYLPQNLGHMLRPRLTFYWQYLIDDSLEAHSFGGIGPEILGTLLVTILSMTFVVPLGVVGAAYLVEHAGDNWTVRVIRLAVNTLAGVPSIVFGLFGLAFFVLTVLPDLGLGSNPCILTASLTLAVLTLPVMIRSSEEAIRAVPAAYKEAALALGAGRLRTFLTVTLPAAMPGILTGAILSLSRVAGETAPILFTGAVAAGPVPRSILQPTRTLSYGSYDMAVGDRIAMMFPHNQYGMVMTLVVLILALNITAIVLRNRMFARLKGHR